MRAASPAAAFRRHVQTCNRWWAENLPYLDVPDDNIEKTLYHRWWLLRYNYLDADIPGSDYQFPTAMEGVLGYNNAIALTVGMFVDDLKYLRDPAYSYGPWVSAGEVSRNGQYTDNPGDPENWSNYKDFTLRGDLADAVKPTSRPLHFTTHGLTLAPFHIGDDTPYHAYFTRSEPVIVFGAADSGVPNRPHPDGRTFLDALWQQAPFVTSAHFVRAVRGLADRRLAENLLTRSEHDRVIAAANAADLRR